MPDPFYDLLVEAFPCTPYGYVLSIHGTDERKGQLEVFKVN